MTFAGAFDMVHTLKHDLETMLNFSISFSTINDSKFLLDVITTASYTTEKRLMID